MCDFKAFLTKTNALALAIGVIIGGALGAVVSLAGQRRSSCRPSAWPSAASTSRDQDHPREATAQSGEEVAIRWGAFLNSIIAFIVVASSCGDQPDVHQGGGAGRPVCRGDERPRSRR